MSTARILSALNWLNYYPDNCDGKEIELLIANYFSASPNDDNDNSEECDHRNEGELSVLVEIYFHLCCYYRPTRENKSMNVYNPRKFIKQNIFLHARLYSNNWYSEWSWWQWWCSRWRVSVSLSKCQHIIKFTAFINTLSFPFVTSTRH